MKLFVPQMVINATTNADLKIVSIPVKLNGRKTMYLGMLLCHTSIASKYSSNIIFLSKCILTTALFM